MEIIISVLIFFGAIAFTFWLFFLAPAKLTEFAKNAIYTIIIYILDLFEFARTVIALATLGVYFVGTLGTIVVLLLSLIIFVNEVSHIYGFQVLASEPIYQKWLKLFGESYSWAAITAIVASTVALNNVLKYELELKQFILKQKEQMQEKVK